jgi:hypothetical protein
LTKISEFDQNCQILPKQPKFTKIAKFYQNGQNLQKSQNCQILPNIINLLYAGIVQVKIGCNCLPNFTKYLWFYVADSLAPEFKRGIY